MNLNLLLIFCFVFFVNAKHSSVTILVPGTLLDNKTESITCIFHNQGNLSDVLIQVVVTLDQNLTKIFFNQTYDLELNQTEDGYKIKQTESKLGTQMFILDFSIPAVKSTIQSAIVIVSIDSNKPDLNVTFARDVFVKKSVERLLFIETDKDVYRPGEKITIRLIALDTELMPVSNEKATVWIDTPSDIRVFKWIDLDISNGIIQFDDIISKSTEIGFYTIGLLCSEQLKIEAFEVTSYIKQRFEVVVKPDHPIYAEQEQATFTTCAHYFHGHAVIGHGNVAVYKQDQRLQSFNLTFTGQECQQFTIDLTGLELKRMKSVSRFVRVSVTEAETGIETSTTHRINVAIAPYTIVFLDTANPSIKPGIPYKAALLLESTFNLDPVANQTIEVCVTFDERSYAKNAKNLLTFRKCLNYISNEDGKVFFTIPDMSPDVKRISVSASALNCTTKVVNNSVYSMQPKANRIINSWFSPSSHFLQFEPIYDQIDCSENISFNFRYLLDDFSQQIDVNYLVTCQNILVAYGNQLFGSMNSEEITNKSDSTFIFTKSTSRGGSFADLPAHLMRSQLDVNNFKHKYIHPGCNIFAFYLTPKHEIVGDIQRFRLRNCFKKEVKINSSEEEVKQGEKTEIVVEADPSSVCLVSAVDQKIESLKRMKRISFHSQLEAIEDIHRLSVPFIEDLFRCQHYSLREMIKPFIEYKRRHKRSATKMPPEVEHDDMIYDTRDAFNELNVVYMTDNRKKVETRPCLDSQVDLTVSAMGKLAAIFNTFEFVRMNNSTFVQRKEMFNRFHAPTSLETLNLVAGTVNTNEITSSLIKGRKRIATNFESQSVWFYKVVTINDDGMVKLRYKLPYSVASWTIDAVCINKESGLSVAQSKTIKSNSKIFVSSFFPKKVKRNERVKLRYFVYTKTFAPVLISILNSSEFLVINETEKVICNNGTTEVNFVVKPLIASTINVTVMAKTSADHSSYCNVSNVDQVSIKYNEKLKVEAKGVRAQFVRTIYICPNETNLVLTFTNATINNSLNAFILASGDLFSRYCIENEYFTLSLPKYAGEPNLLRIWKSYLALNYNQFLNYSFFGKPEKSIAINTLQKAHKHQIAFRKPDGSFTQFIVSKSNQTKHRRDNNEESSLFITAHALKSLAMIKKYIFVDFVALEQTLDWVLSLQDDQTGCWSPFGPVINHHLRDNETGTSLTTAFVMIALLEAKHWLHAPVNGTIESGFRCLKNTTKQNAYNLVLTAYVHSIANRSEEANQYLQQLMSMATDDNVNKVTFWEQEVPGEQWVSKSTSVQIAAYYILTALKVDQNSTKLTNVIKWLIGQQNTFGGYQSSFDTSVALQALYEISIHNFVSNFEQDLKIIDDKDLIAYTAHITNKTRFLLNTKDLGKLPQYLNITTQGNGCVYVQVEEFFLKTKLNKKSVEPFSVAITTHRFESDSCKLVSISIDLDYQAANESSMVIVEVALVSGLEPCLKSLDQLVSNENNSVAKYDRSLDKLFIYLKSLKKGEHSLIQFILIEMIEIEDRKPGIVRVYDYYDNHMKTELNYNAPNSIECGQSLNYSRPASMEQVARFFGKSGTIRNDTGIIEEYYLGNKNFKATERREYLYIVHDEDKYNGRFDLTSDSSD